MRNTATRTMGMISRLSAAEASSMSLSTAVLPPTMTEAPSMSCTAVAHPVDGVVARPGSRVAAARVASR